MEDVNYFEIMSAEEARQFTSLVAAAPLAFADSSGIIANGTIKPIAPAPQSQTLWTISLQNIQSIGNIQVTTVGLTTSYFKFGIKSNFTNSPSISVNFLVPSTSVPTGTYAFDLIGAATGQTTLNYRLYLNYTAPVTTTSTTTSTTPRPTTTTPTPPPPRTTTSTTPLPGTLSFVEDPSQTYVYPNYTINWGPSTTSNTKWEAYLDGIDSSGFIYAGPLSANFLNYFVLSIRSNGSSRPIFALTINQSVPVSSIPNGLYYFTLNGYSSNPAQAQISVKV